MIQKAMIHRFHHLAVEQRLQVLDVEHHSGAFVRLAGNRHLEE